MMDSKNLHHNSKEIRDKLRLLTYQLRNGFRNLNKK